MFPSQSRNYVTQPPYPVFRHTPSHRSPGLVRVALPWNRRSPRGELGVHDCAHDCRKMRPQFAHSKIRPLPRFLTAPETCVLNSESSAGDGGVVIDNGDAETVLAKMSPTLSGGHSSRSESSERRCRASSSSNVATPACSSSSR